MRVMGKAKRNRRPALGEWELNDRDGYCWACKHRNNCNQCKFARSVLKDQRFLQKRKGKTSRKNKQNSYFN